MLVQARLWCELPLTVAAMGSLAQVPQGLAAGALPVFLICYAIPGILWGRVRPAWARGLDATRRPSHLLPGTQGATSYGWLNRKREQDTAALAVPSAAR